MVPVNLLLTQEVFNFYAKIASVTKLPLERILADSLFKLAGELSLEALCAGHISD